ncbi:MAG: FkbM family methyltransferase [Candidatus Omnitrophota bacterium]
MTTLFRGAKLRFKKILERFAPGIYRVVRKRYYLRLCRSFCIKNEPDLSIIRHLIKPGHQVIDIGANIGGHTKVLSVLVGSGGRVYSIEPLPSTYEILVHNCKKLGLDNVEAINMAVSSRSGSVQMSLPTDASGAETHYRAAVVDNDFPTTGGQMIEVPAITMDGRFLSVARQIAFIKCDIEAHELECLKGAREFLAMTQCAWLVEVSGDPGRPGSQAQKVFKYFIDSKYTAWRVDGLALRPRCRGDNGGDTFFLKQEHLDRLKLSQGVRFAADCSS